MKSLKSAKQKFYKNAPETILIITSYGRDSISLKSIESLLDSIEAVRDRIKIIVSDATPSIEKAQKIIKLPIDDFLWTPNFTPAATSRNIVTEYIKDKYSSKYICFLEDDFEYSKEWYPTIVNITEENFGKISPWGLAYGVFSASPHRLEKDRIKKDKENNLISYIFGAVADQRFMPLSHYLTVMRNWDPDLLGISFCQTGGQTLRNLMRGYCGGIIENQELCIPIAGSESTWTKGKRNPGPPAHDFDTKKYKIICDIASENSYEI